MINYLTHVRFKLVPNLIIKFRKNRLKINNKFLLDLNLAPYLNLPLVAM